MPALRTASKGCPPAGGEPRHAGSAQYLALLRIRQQQSIDAMLRRAGISRFLSGQRTNEWMTGSGDCNFFSEWPILGAFLTIRFAASQRQLLAIAAVRDAGAERLSLVDCCQSTGGTRTAAIHIRAFETCQSATGPKLPFPYSSAAAFSGVEWAAGVTDCGMRKAHIRFRVVLFVVLKGVWRFIYMRFNDNLH